MSNFAVLGFMVGGALGGALAGLFDGLTALGGAHGGGALLMAGSFGLHLLVGLALGALVGLLYPLVPEDMAAGQLGRQALRRLWPGRDDALHERCRAVALIWISVLLLEVGVAALAWGFGVLMQRIASPAFAAAAIALSSLLGLVLALLLAAPLAAGFTRGLETLVRRVPALSPLSHPALNLLIAFVWVMLSILGWMRSDAETVSALDVRPLVAVALMLGAVLVLGDLLRSRVARAPAPTLFALLALASAGAAGAFAGLDAPKARAALGKDTGSSRLVLLLARAPFDDDQDGFADVLGGGDCDDTNPAIHPGAVEVPDNEIDEDCDGVDLELPPPPPEEPPSARIARMLRPPYNLVLVTIDSLRADHVGVYGYRRPTTPNLDRVAREGTVFRNAYSPSAKTPTAVPAMFSGRYPSELVRNDRHFVTYPAVNTFVAEVLQDRGYHTAGFPSHWYFEAKYGLNQGFEVWQPFFVTPREMEEVPTAEPVVTRTLEHLERLTPERGPWFAWLHLLDPHKNYIEHPGVPKFGDDPVDRYDHEVRYVDAWLGRLVETLRARPDWTRTVLIVTSDHGEAFGENGYRFHGFGLHEHQIRVPLVVRIPGVKPRVVTERVNLVDLAPTLLQLAGVTEDDPVREALSMAGRSLAPLALGEGGEGDRPMFAEMPKGPHNPTMVTLISGPWKIHHSAEGDHYQLFDLEADPGEQKDLWAERPEAAEEMKVRLQRFRARLDTQPAVP